MKNILMAKSAAKLIDECLCIRKNEKVLIVSDLNLSNIAEILALILQEREIDFSLCFMIPRTRHAENPPKPIESAMCNADAILIPTTYSLTHSLARINANKKGARILSLPGYSEEMMLSDALNVDFKKLKQKVLACGNLLDIAKKAHITSESGTDLYINLEGKNSISKYGIADEPGMWAAPPGIEAAIAPVEYSTNGLVVLDGVLIPGGVVTDKIEIEFKNGKISQVIGGLQASEFSNLLASYNDPNVYQAVELGIGLNPKAKFGKNLIENEVVYGTVHIGIGEGASFGSNISACAHLDIVIKNPQLELDGKIILSDKKLKIE